MKRKYIVWLSVIFVFTMLSLLIAGCGSDKVADDMVNYMNNEFPRVLSFEDEISKLDEKLFSSDDPKAALDVINKEILPKYDEFIEELEGIKPETPEIKELHEICIKSINAEQSAYMEFASIIEKEDSSALAKINDRLAEVRKNFRDFENKVEELAKEHNIEIEE